MDSVEGIAFRVPPHLDAHDALPRLHARPERVIDDPQMWNFGDLAVFLLVDAGDLLPRLWVLDVGAAVPLHAPDIERVVQQSGAAIDLPADGGVAPGPSARSGHAFLVELFVDRAQ